MDSFFLPFIAAGGARRRFISFWLRYSDYSEASPIIQPPLWVRGTHWAGNTEAVHIFLGATGALLHVHRKYFMSYTIVSWKRDHGWCVNLCLIDAVHTYMYMYITLHKPLALCLVQTVQCYVYKDMTLHAWPVHVHVEFIHIPSSRCVGICVCMSHVMSPHRPYPCRLCI